MNFSTRDARNGGKKYRRMNRLLRERDARAFHGQQVQAAWKQIKREQYQQWKRVKALRQHEKKMGQIIGALRFDVDEDGMIVSRAPPPPVLRRLTACRLASPVQMDGPLASPATIWSES